MNLETKVRLDLRRMDRDPRALSRLIGIKRSVVELKGAMEEAKTLGSSLEFYNQIAELVKDIPEGVDCFCCGFKNLRNFQRRDGHIIGPECINHALGECRKK